MNYDTPYNSLGVVDPVSTSLVSEIAAQLGPLIQKLGVTNDNGVIAARDKIANYVTQVIGDRTAAYKQLYEGYQLAHDDINNVGTTAYYTRVMQRLNNAVLNYIANHAAESSAIFGEDIDPVTILNSYKQHVQNGRNLDHAFWLAFTGRKDPYDIRTGTGSPSPTTQPKPSDAYQFIKDASGEIKEIRDAAGNLLSPGSPEYNKAINASTPDGNFNTTALLMVGGVLLLSGIAYVVSKNKSSN